jgi:hypothetical protein
MELNGVCGGYQDDKLLNKEFGNKKMLKQWSFEEL